MRFRFEIKLWRLASQLAGRLKPQGMESDPSQPWLFEIGPGEHLGALTPARMDLPALRERLRDAGATYLLFDPYDFPESFQLEWHNLHQSTAEELFAKPFVEADFTSRHNSGHQPWPDSWTVHY